MNEKVYEFKKIYPMDKETAWELMSNTDHLNRVSGVFTVHFSNAEYHDSTLYRTAKAKAAGFVPLEWVEHPFEWVKNEFYSVERVYRSGPIKRFHWTISFENVSRSEADPQVELTFTGKFTPANLLGLLAIPTSAVNSIKEIMKYLDKCLEANQQSSINILPVHGKVELDEMQLSKKSARLLTFHQNPDQVNLLMNHLTSASDDEVLDMQPYYLADRWSINRSDALYLFLHAVKSGLLNQSWNLMCPNCRAAKNSVSAMNQLVDQVHCDLCGVDYEMTLDRYVEMRFSVHPSVRKARNQVYCLSGPSRSPHILSQKRIAPGETSFIQYPVKQGDLRLRVLKFNHSIKLDQNQHPDQPSAVYHDTGWDTDNLHINKNGGALQISNQTDKEIVVLIEKMEWDHYAITGASIATLQIYRDLFSNEVLSPDQQIGVETVTVLFSDLKGSTALYESVGDANAYHQVHQHFNYLKKHVAANSGGIVKTIGDSIMAVFLKKEDALRAAISIQTGLHEFNKDSQTSLKIKLGLFSGPVIAVNANDILDYFGRTVNISARIQQKSEGEDIVLTTSDFAELSEVFSSHQFKTEKLTTKLAGIHEKAELVRIFELGNEATGALNEAAAAQEN
ncbi:adenylate/guanylate cyclase domain-containing protein [Jeotgalibacillus aurantiacus]|uniref:adenylate/guanylate cyclase domain-containing protein n=1 Tax=Jeotgalibacillus aurantiacus TaxID=2763266 RepID=UPI001D0A2008|nr:adenylate/guanylate cyclase domain-containing protein [Jeotgalibacillus aurantiacus]